MSENVLADAQFTVASVLRPFAGFESVYQNQKTTTPIVFPGTLDPDAGHPGFSPYLLQGLAVPLGAKVMLWIPMINQVTEGGVLEYTYVLVWRMRNTGDFQRRRLPYHLSKEAEAAPDTWLAPTPPGRFLLPAAVETVIYQQTEPTALTPPSPTGVGAGVGNLRTEAISVPSDGVELASDTVGLPFLPPGSAPAFANGYPLPGASTTPLGAFEQGVIDPAISNLAPYPLFRPYFTVAKGDELLISVTRVPLTTSAPGTETWNFNTTDQQFSNYYGTNAFPPTGQTTHKPFPDLGVYIWTGSNPS